jgi:O-antigen/teichoic acid export membrane protein
MQASSRVVLNTIAQYVRTIINIVLSLITVRIVLRTLGVEDFGIYSLIAGVVSMLTFVTGALATTTQRYISYYQGVNNLKILKDVFANSFLIHLGLGIIVFVVLASIAPLLFNGFLNIPPDRNSAAVYVYFCVISMVLITFACSPFKALCVAHENIVFNSVIDVLDGIIKLVLVLLMVYIPWDKLVYYGLTLLFVQIINLVIFLTYCGNKYKECVWPKLSYIRGKYIKGMLSFAGWNIYSTGCWVGRQQGVAIVLNKMMSATVNAAYGVGFHISSYTNFLANAIAAAIQPQIVMNEGAGDREKALWLTSISCKFSFFLTAMVVVPCIFEIDSILKLWLGDVPEYTSLFCVMALSASLFNSLTGSLGHINQAVGNIKMYSILTNTPKLLTIPFAWLALYINMSLVWLVVIYVLIEFVCSWIRIPFIHRTASLDIAMFVKNVLLPEIVPTFLCVTTCFACSKMLDFKFDFILTFALSFIIYSFSIYKWGLTPREKDILLKIAIRIKSFKK